MSISFFLSSHIDYDDQKDDINGIITSEII
jgi:hypothetical protein